MKTWIIGCCLLMLPAVSMAGELRLSVAASLTEAVKEIARTYQEAHPETVVLPNFASSGALARQVVAGAPADIYIAANPKWMAYLQTEGFIATTAAQTLVHNRLVFVGMPTTAFHELADLSDVGRIAMASPKSSPAGRYAEQALIAANLYQPLSAANTLVFAKDVRQALLYADRGEVDGAFVYRTDALLVTRAQVLFDVPQQLYPQVVYPAAVTRSGSGKVEVEAFFAYLFSADSRKVFNRYGFLLPE